MDEQQQTRFDSAYKKPSDKNRAHTMSEETILAFPQKQKIILKIKQ